MNLSRSAAVALFASVGAFALPLVSHAQGAGISRTDLQRHDLSVPGREMVQVLVGFAAGAMAGNHHHHGEEVVYVTQGALEYRLEGRPPVTVKAGEALFIPSGVNHEVRNVGNGPGAELATYIVEKGKPLLVPAPAQKATAQAGGAGERVRLVFADERPLPPTPFDAPTAWDDEP